MANLKIQTISTVAASVALAVAQLVAHCLTATVAGSSPACEMQRQPLDLRRSVAHCGL